MSTRTRQTVIESKIIATIPREDKGDLDIRCLCFNDRLARFIVVSHSDLDGYQVPILAEASLNLKTNRSSFNLGMLDYVSSELIQKEVKGINKEKLLAIKKG